MQAPHTFIRHFPKSEPLSAREAVCFAHDFEDHDCPDQDVRLRTQLSWCHPDIAPAVVVRDDSPKTLMPISDVTRYDGPNDFAGQSIRLRPNPDRGDSGPAPVPAGRSGCSDTYPNITLQCTDPQLPSLDDMETAENSPPELQCMKALVPLSKLKGLVDEDDIQDVRETRCDTAPTALRVGSLPARRLEVCRSPTSRRSSRRA
jgi:hypothetical protein